MKKTKFKSKIFIVSAVAALLAGTLSIGALAASEVDAEHYAEGTEADVSDEAEAFDESTETEGEATVEEGADEGEDSSPKTADDGKTDGNVTGGSTSLNFFEKLYDAVTDYISEILCVLAFGGSFLIAVLYKKGLLPMLKGALGAISSAVGRIKDATEKSAIVESETTAKITDALDKAYRLIEAQTRSLDEVEKRLDALSADKGERERMRVILESEVELLYDIFMSSALPEYQKDAVAKRLKAISSYVKEEIAEA